MRGLVITGTDTGVGKSYFAWLLIRALRERGIDAVGYKPVCCGGREDATHLWEASEKVEPLDVVNPLWLKAPAAPLVAAELEKTVVDLQQLRLHGEALAARHEVVICEGVGGWEVPMAGKDCFGDFAAALGWPVLLVSANRLGALNHTLLTANAIAARGCSLVGLVLNHLEEERDVAMVSNKAILATWLQLPLLAELMPGQDWLDEEVVEALAAAVPAIRP